MTVHSAIPTRPLNRWWMYQRERFPLLAHGTLVAAFSSSAVCLSVLLRNTTIWPSAQALIVAFVVSLLFFLLLRIADEFKDAETDARYRPERAVPRGLVQLRELGWLGAAAMATQLALTSWLDLRLVPLLIGGWLYWALMSKEFFVHRWLKARPFAYLWTHMLIIVWIDLFATACDWLVAGTPPPHGLLWFLGTSFLNGVVIEVGRKLRAPADERPGVETYTAVWGVRRAALVWLGAMLLAATCALMIASQIGTFVPTLVLNVVLVAASALLALRFCRQPTTSSAKRFEIYAFVWTLATYLSLGVVPLIARAI